MLISLTIQEWKNVLLLISALFLFDAFKIWPGSQFSVLQRFFCVLAVLAVTQEAFNGFACSHSPSWNRLKKSFYTLSLPRTNSALFTSNHVLRIFLPISFKPPNSRLFLYAVLHTSSQMYNG